MLDKPASKDDVVAGVGAGGRLDLLGVESVGHDLDMFATRADVCEVVRGDARDRDRMLGCLGREFCVYNRNYSEINPAENVSLEEPFVAIPLANDPEKSKPPSSPDIRNELAMRVLCRQMYGQWN